jgi:hypothetical protein
MNLLKKFDEVVSRSSTWEYHSRWRPLSERQCKALVLKYADDVTLWDKFWLFMGEQVNKGCPFEYVRDSADLLEQVWTATKRTHWGREPLTRLNANP